MLPYPVDKNKGKAKFDSDKGILEVTLPTIRDSLIEALCKWTHKINKH